MDLEIIEARGLKFHARPGTSDAKAVKEVVTGKGYDTSTGEGKRSSGNSSSILLHELT